MTECQIKGRHTVILDSNQNKNYYYIPHAEIPYNIASARFWILSAFILEVSLLFYLKLFHYGFAIRARPEKYFSVFINRRNFSPNFVSEFFLHYHCSAPMFYYAGIFYGFFRNPARRAFSSVVIVVFNKRDKLIK